MVEWQQEKCCRNVLLFWNSLIFGKNLQENPEKWFFLLNFQFSLIFPTRWIFRRNAKKSKPCFRNFSCKIGENNGFSLFKEEFSKILRLPGGSDTGIPDEAGPKLERPFGVNATPELSFANGLLIMKSPLGFFCRFWINSYIRGRNPQLHEKC